MYSGEEGLKKRSLNKFQCKKKEKTITFQTGRGRVRDRGHGHGRLVLLGEWHLEVIR